MVPKRGQPPKPPEERKKSTLGFRVTNEEKALLEEAYKLSGVAETFSRWVVGITLEEARRIVEDSKK